MNFLMAIRSFQPWFFFIGVVFLQSGFTGGLEILKNPIFLAGILFLILDLVPALINFRSLRVAHARFALIPWVLLVFAMIGRAGSLYFAGLSQEIPTGVVPGLRDTLFFFSLLLSGSSVLFRFGTNWTGEQRDKPLPGRDKIVFNNLILMVLAVVLFAVVNLGAARYDHVMDLSPGYFSLTDGSRKIIQGLKGDIRIYVFLPGQQALRSPNRDRTLPELYHLAEDIRLIMNQLEISPAIHLEYRNAELASDTTGDFRAVTNGTIILRKLTENAAGELPYVERKIYIKNESDLSGFEIRLVRALIQISSREQSICFPSRNGEITPRSIRTGGGVSVKKVWENVGMYNFQFRILEEGTDWPVSVPPFCDLLFISGPTHPYGPVVRSAIQRYAKSGGRILSLVDGRSIATQDWLLESLGSGYRLQKGQMSVVRTYPGLILTDSVGIHPVTDAIQRSMRPFFAIPAYAYYKETQKPAPGLEEKALVYSGFRSFLDGNLNGARDPGEKNVQAPLLIALSPVPDKKKPEKGFRLIMASDMDWLSDAILGFPMDHKNSELLIESILWLTETDLVSGIPEEARVSRRIRITDDVKSRSVVYGVIIYPVTVVSLLSLILFLVRKKGEGDQG